MASWHERAFFGIHYDLHAQANDTELGREVTPELLGAAWEKIRPDWIQCDCKGHAGYTSWPTEIGYASPGIVRDALRVHRDVTRRMGLPLVMHYSGVWDEAAVHHHPDWARVGPNGRRESGRACPRGPYAERLLIPQMLELVDRYDVDGFWVDGDVWSTAPCYCSRCAAAFAAETGLAEPPRAPGQPGWAQWLAFHRASYDAYVRRYVEAVHARKPDCLVCVNWLYSVRHPDSPTLPVDFLSGDFSHAWGLERAIAEARMLDGRGRPWDLMAWGFTTGETTWGGWHFKTAAHLCQEVSEVVANGGAVCVYVQPARSGHLFSWDHDVVAEVAQFCRARQAVAQDTVSVPQAAVLHGQSHYYAHCEPLYGLASANAAVEGALHALLETHHHADLRNEDGLLAGLERYPLVVVAEQDPVADRVSASLARYVQAGGSLVLSGAHVARHDALAELAGVRPSGPAREGFHYLPVDGAAVTVAGPWQPVELAGAEAWAELLADREPGKDGAGTPAITLRRVGPGRVAAAHGPLFAAYRQTHYPRLRSLLRQLFAAVWERPAVGLEVPAEVAAAQIALTLRRQGDRTIVHLLNRGASPAPSPRNVMVEKVPPIGPLTVRLELADRPAAVTVVPADGSTPDWSWRDGRLEVRLERLHYHAAIVVA